MLDKHGIPLKAYKELSLSPNADKLPRSYIVEGCKEALGSDLEITKTPGDAVGREQSLIKALTSDTQIDYDSTKLLRVS